MLGEDTGSIPQRRRGSEKLRGSSPLYEWHQHGGDAIRKSQDPAEEGSLPGRRAPGRHRLRRRVQQPRAGGSLPELQPEAGADSHPQSAGGADSGRVVAVPGGAPVQPASHLVQGLLPSALCGVPVAIHRHQRQVPASDAAAANCEAGPAVQLYLRVALLPVPTGAWHVGASQHRGPRAGHVAAHARHPRGLCAAAGANAAGCAFRGDAGCVPLHCHSDVGHREETEAVETGKC